MKKLVSLLVVAAFLFAAGNAIAKPKKHKRHKGHKKPVATQPAAAPVAPAEATPTK